MAPVARFLAFYAHAAVQARGTVAGSPARRKWEKRSAQFFNRILSRKKSLFIPSKDFVFYFAAGESGPDGWRISGDIAKNVLHMGKAGNQGHQKLV